MLGDLDPLRERPQMVAPITAVASPSSGDARPGRIRHQMIEPVHLDRAALAARLALTRCDRAGVITIVFRFAGGGLPLKKCSVL